MLYMVLECAAIAEYWSSNISSNMWVLSQYKKVLGK